MGRAALTCVLEFECRADPLGNKCCDKQAPKSFHKLIFFSPQSVRDVFLNALRGVAMTNKRYNKEIFKIGKNSSN